MSPGKFWLRAKSPYHSGSLPRYCGRSGPQSSKMLSDDNPEMMTDDLCRQEPLEGADSRRMTPFPSTVEQPSVQRRRNQPLNRSKSAASRPLKVLLSASDRKST